MLKIIILNLFLSQSFQVLATKVEKPTTLPAVNCNQSLKSDEGATSEGATSTDAAIYNFRESSLSITEIRFDPWNSSHLPQVPDFYLQENPDSDSLILRSQNLGVQPSGQTDKRYLAPMDARFDLAMRTSQHQFPSTVLITAESQMVGFTIQRLGDDRYFEFTPEDSSEAVTARVLDIQEVHGELKILAEWVTVNRNKTVVGLLTTEELRSIQRPSDPQRFAEKAISLFESLLSPEALYIKDGFRSEGLPTLFNEGERPNRIEPFNSPVYTYFTNASLKFFPEARSGVEAYFKMVDRPASTEMMENLDPNFIYNWIVNENGELQISVHVEKPKDTDNVPRPTLYLLSKGRGILEGGYLKHDGDRWQAIIDSDGGFYGVLSTQDVEIDVSDDVLGYSTGAKAFFHSSHTKVLVIPYLNHLEEYVYWIQEAFYVSTGLIPEVGRYLKNLNLWHQSEFSLSRSMDRPTTEEEARAFTILEKFYAKQNRVKKPDKTSQKNTERTRRADRARSANSTRNTRNENNGKNKNNQNTIDRHQETELRTPWMDPLDLILFFAEDFNTKITDLPSALWALRIDMMDEDLDLNNEKTIKRFYQKILSQYHQDSLVKSSAGPEEIRIGHAVTTIITRAWGTYKKELKKRKI